MLRRLIKYDLKVNMKIFLLLHLIFIIACVLGRLFFVNKLDFTLPSGPLISSIAIFVSIYLFLFMAISFCTWLIITFRFYRNLFSREGYLTWTLPATGIQHLWAKLISGFLLLVADTLVVSLCIPLLVTGRNVVEIYSTVSGEVTAELGMPISAFYIYMCIFMVFSCITTVVTTYFCITVGQLFPGHRVLCAIAAYFVTSLVIQIISTLLMLAFDLFPNQTLTESSAVPVSDYLFQLLILSTVLMVIITIAEYAVTHWIMKKKINLI